MRANTPNKSDREAFLLRAHGDPIAAAVEAVHNLHPTPSSPATCGTLMGVSAPHHEHRGSFSETPTTYTPEARLGSAPNSALSTAMRAHTDVAAAAHIIRAHSPLSSPTTSIPTPTHHELCGSFSETPTTYTPEARLGDSPNPT